MAGSGRRLGHSMFDYLPGPLRRYVERVQDGRLWMDRYTGPPPGPEYLDTLFFSSGNEYVRLDDGAFEILPGIGRAPVQDEDGTVLRLCLSGFVISLAVALYFFLFASGAVATFFWVLFSLMSLFFIRKGSWVIFAAFSCRPRIIFSYSRQSVFLVYADGTITEEPFNNCRLGIHYGSEEQASPYSEKGGLFLCLSAEQDKQPAAPDEESEHSMLLVPRYSSTLVSAWGSPVDAYDYVRLLGLHNFILHYMACGTKYILQDVPDVNAPFSSVRGSVPAELRGVEFAPPRDALRLTRPPEVSFGASLLWLVACILRIPFGNLWFAGLKRMYAPLPPGLTEKLYVPGKPYAAAAFEAALAGADTGADTDAGAHADACVDEKTAEAAPVPAQAESEEFSAALGQTQAEEPPVVPEQAEPDGAFAVSERPEQAPAFGVGMVADHARRSAAAFPEPVELFPVAASGGGRAGGGYGNAGAPLWPAKEAQTAFFARNAFAELIAGETAEKEAPAAARMSHFFAGAPGIEREGPAAARRVEPVNLAAVWESGSSGGVASPFYADPAEQPDGNAEDGLWKNLSDSGALDAAGEKTGEDWVSRAFSGKHEFIG